MRLQLGWTLMSLLAVPVAAMAQGDVAGTPPADAYFPAAHIKSVAEAAQQTRATPNPTPLSADLLVHSNAPLHWVQTHAPSPSGSTTCGISADLGDAWTLGLLADIAQPTIFTLTVSRPDIFPASGKQRVAIYYDRGFQTFTGTASGNAVSIMLDGTNFGQFLHGFTAGSSMLIMAADAPLLTVNLAGTSAAIAALGQCTTAAGFLQLPSPWHAARDARDSYQDQMSVASVSHHRSDTWRADHRHGENNTDGGTLISLISIGVVAVIAGRFCAVRYARAKALSLSKKEIDAQSHRLGVRRQQLLIPDYYGTIDLSKWEKEKEKFIQSRILPVLKSGNLKSQFPKIAAKVYAYVELKARMAGSDPVANKSISNPRVFSPGMAPGDYEMHCALLLRQAGWDANHMGKSGDQGTDVLARSGRLTLVVQCKLYSGSVGNDAVQQVIAARAFQRAQIAVVVSNQRYTRSARALAASSSVYLLHHSDLPSFSPARMRGHSAAAVG